MATATEGNLQIESYIRVTEIAHAIERGWSESIYSPDYLSRVLSESFPELASLELRELIRKLYSDFLAQFGESGLNRHEYIAIHLFDAASRVVEPTGSPLPSAFEVPGVYRAISTMEGFEIIVQRSEQGQWWPYPYRPSVLEASEIAFFELKLIPELQIDVPEILDPEAQADIEELTGALLESFPEISDDRARSFAQKLLVSDEPGDE